MNNLFASFSLTDAFILVIVLAIIAAVIFFGFIKKSKDGGCKGCPYAKECPRTDEEKKKVKKGRLSSCSEKIGGGKKSLPDETKTDAQSGGTKEEVERGSQSGVETPRKK